MRELILGTDWWTDCDDVVAVRLLCRAHHAGEIRLLGAAINACMEYSVASLRGFLRAEGVEIPLGIDRDATDYGGKPSYQRRLAETLAPEVGNSDAEDAVRLYRRLLAAAASRVDILELGFLQVLAALLASPADELSPLTGRELVRDKVARFWIMGGKWDEDGGVEHNFAKTDRARLAASAFVRDCPVPITFLGWEVGYGVISGGESALVVQDPLMGAMSDHGSQRGRHSWDPMTALLAVIGEERPAGYDTVCGTATVDAATGANHFAIGDGMHRFVVKAKENSYYENEINRRIASVL